MPDLPPAPAPSPGVDPREMAKSDLVVIWGTNAVSTQVNVMTHATRARKERGAKIAAVDVYMNGTMEQADLPVLVKPGTDGALACAVMHCLFRDGNADWDYLDKYTDAPRELEAHVRTRDPQWASAITGTPVETIEEFAKLIGERKRAFFRLGYGFSRSRNGAANMHAASCIPAVTGAWQLEGGGAFHINADIYKLDKTMIEGLDVCDRSVRMLDQSRIGAILTGDAEALHGGPPVTAMLIQNTNPRVGRARPEQGEARLCARGSVRLRARAVHDRDRADGRRGAAGDDVPRARRHLSRRRPPIHHPRAEAGRAAGRMPQQSRGDLRARPSGSAPSIRGFAMSPRELIDQMLQVSKRGTLAELEANRWLDCQPPFRQAHFLDGFTWPDGKFRFKPDWNNVPFRSPYKSGPIAADAGAAGSLDLDRSRRTTTHPFRLATSPARGFLNSTFNETPTSLAQEKRPSVMIHPDDAAGARDRRRRRCGARQYARPGAPARAAVRRRAARRADRGIDLAEFGLCRRLRHQHADRRGFDRALWRRGLPRQQSVDQAARAVRRTYFARQHIVDAETAAAAHEQHESAAGDGEILAEEDVLQALRRLRKLPIEVRGHKGDYDKDEREQRAVPCRRRRGQRDDNDPLDDMREHAHQVRA